MKKWLMLLGAAVVLLFPTREGTELGELIPVELICISREENDTTVRTDTGNCGVGRTLAEAVESLKQNAAGTICLDTADYVILSREIPWQELLEVLRPSTELCYGEKIGDLQKAAAYLRIHSPEANLRDLRSGLGTIPELQKKEGQLHLEE